MFVIYETKDLVSIQRYTNISGSTTKRGPTSVMSKDEINHSLKYQILLDIKGFILVRDLMSVTSVIRSSLQALTSNNTK